MQSAEVSVAWKSAALAKLSRPRLGRPSQRAFGRALPAIAFLVTCFLLAVPAGAQTQQSPASRPPPTPSQVHAHTHHKRKKTVAKPTPAVVAPVVAAPPPPVPPAQQNASPATIKFAQNSLSIDAQNSSLMQILNQVAHDTGLQIEGLDRDERIYGQYGPGPVANTLTTLLNGSGYDYVLVGGNADTPPSKLLLSPAASSASGANANNFTAPSSGAVSPGATQPTPPDNSADPSRPKTPQEIFDELRKMHPQ